MISIESSVGARFTQKSPPEAGLKSSEGVEVAGIEPASKHIRQKLSTCLFHYYLSAMNRK